MKIIQAISFTALLIISYSCGKISSDSNDLGGHFSILEGDKKEERIIVYCTSNVGECYAGIPVIPHRKDSLTKYVTRASSDEKCIYVKSVDKQGIFFYWIIKKGLELDLKKCETINCDSLILNNVSGPLDYESLKAEVTALKSNFNTEEIK